MLPVVVSSYLKIPTMNRVPIAVNKVAIQKISLNVQMGGFSVTISNVKKITIPEINIIDKSFLKSSILPPLFNNSHEKRNNYRNYSTKD